MDQDGRALGIGEQRRPSDGDPYNADTVVFGGGAGPWGRERSCFVQNGDRFRTGRVRPVSSTGSSTAQSTSSQCV